MHEKKFMDADIIAIILAIVLQDLPFICLRLTLILKYFNRMNKNESKREISQIWSYQSYEYFLHLQKQFGYSSSDL